MILNSNYHLNCPGRIVKGLWKVTSQASTTCVALNILNAHRALSTQWLCKPKVPKSVYSPPPNNMVRPVTTTPHDLVQISGLVPFSVAKTKKKSHSKATWRGKSLLHLKLLSLSLKKIMAETPGSNLETGANAEAMEEACLLVCPWGSLSLLSYRSQEPRRDPTLPWKVTDNS